MSSRNPRGSALMLAPAGLLILMLLGALAVDSAIAFGAQRALESRLVGAVNDASVLALTADELQKGPAATISRDLAVRSVRERVVIASDHGLRVTPNDIAVSVNTAESTVTAEAIGTAPYIFAKAIPGRSPRATVRAAATAQLNYRGAN